ncbi:hypothetical protein NM688_g5273 [Phlebia brevispora]|uniref:Uncharacterized protein n=1 Tax=Phlebia brevispora TaxID=194682 RepID=A0ACC1SY46_9APHY|nr:hypothetical protein NM688_g5273 [Phlebia brevispora]
MNSRACLYTQDTLPIPHRRSPFSPPSVNRQCKRRETHNCDFSASHHTDTRYPGSVLREAFVPPEPCALSILDAQRVMTPYGTRVSAERLPHHKRYRDAWPKKVRTDSQEKPLFQHFDRYNVGTDIKDLEVAFPN